MTGGESVDTLWQPGTDHAGIATQIVVERQPPAPPVWILDRAALSGESETVDNFRLQSRQWAKDSQVTPGAFLRHGGKTNQASTSQQVEQHGLRLTSAVLRQEYSIELQSGKSAIACISCSRFETITLRAIIQCVVRTRTVNIRLPFHG